MAKYWGFNAETHKVLTKDGYILGMHRIRNASVPSNGEVVYLQHGLLDTSFTWVANLPHQSLGEFYHLIAFCFIIISVLIEPNVQHSY